MRIKGPHAKGVEGKDTGNLVLEDIIQLMAKSSQ